MALMTRMFKIRMLRHQGAGITGAGALPLFHRPAGLVCTSSIFFQTATLRPAMQDCNLVLYNANGNAFEDQVWSTSE